MRTLPEKPAQQRPVLLAAGLVTALSFTLVAFEWRTPIKGPKAIPGTAVILFDEEMMPITLRATAPLPPPPPPVLIAGLHIVEQIAEGERAVIEVPSPDPEPGPLVSIGSAPSKKEEDAPDELGPLIGSEVMPSYPGGDAALLKFISENLRYPRDAAENGIQGTVYVSYVVDRDGSIVDVRLLRGVHPSLDREAMRVVKAIKGYDAGRQGGRKVRVQFNIPVKFTLR